MNPTAWSAAYRIGCVQYLNSKPLIHGLPRVALAHPSELAASLGRGELDVALVPVLELLRHPAAYTVVDGVAIASDGPVYSVFVASETAESTPDRWAEVVADPASLTSLHLVQVLLRNALRSHASIVSERSSSLPPNQSAQLLIGNQAIAFRQAHGANRHYWDLGEAWREWTGLPFVYALWVMRRNLPPENQTQIARGLREIARQGIAAIETIASTETAFGVDFARRYLSEHIRFALGEPEKNGLRRFQRELAHAGFIENASAEIRWV
ncbi:MAG: hypothetical protein RLZZ142_2447 [Verrucomicrobiota bacterium]